MAAAHDEHQSETSAERKIEDLSNTAERLAAIIDSSDDAIIAKTITGIVQTWNPAAERLYGYPVSEMVGRPMALLLPPERAGEEAEILARIARGERLHHFETVRLRKDGKRIDISL